MPTRKPSAPRKPASLPLWDRARRALSNPWAQLLASALVAGLISYYTAMATVAPSQDRQARLEGAVQFALSTKTIAGLSADFISAINATGDLTTAKAALRREVAEQIAGLQGLSGLFGSDVITAATEYETALSAFAASINATTSAKEIGSWSTGFDGVVNSHERLKAAMLAELGMRKA